VPTTIDFIDLPDLGPELVMTPLLPRMDPAWVRERNQKEQQRAILRDTPGYQEATAVLYDHWPHRFSIWQNKERACTITNPREGLCIATTPPEGKVLFLALGFSEHAEVIQHLKTQRNSTIGRNLSRRFSLEMVSSESVGLIIHPYDQGVPPRPVSDAFVIAGIIKGNVSPGPQWSDWLWSDPNIIRFPERIKDFRW
jgi:hypothetical protein